MNNRTKTINDDFAFAGEDDVYIYRGMTKRDYFAAQALAAFNSSDMWNEAMARSIAQRAYNLADAMIEERNKKSGKK